MDNDKPDLTKNITGISANKIDAKLTENISTQLTEQEITPGAEQRIIIKEPQGLAIQTLGTKPRSKTPNQLFLKGLFSDNLTYEQRNIRNSMVEKKVDRNGLQKLTTPLQAGYNVLLKFLAMDKHTITTSNGDTILNFTENEWDKALGLPERIERGYPVITGKARIDAKKTLYDLLNINLPIIHKVYYEDKDTKETRVNRTMIIEPLISYAENFPGLTLEQDSKLDNNEQIEKKKQFYIRLSQVFFEDMGKSYLLKWEDFHQRARKLFGKYSPCLDKLQTYINFQLTNRKNLIREDNTLNLEFCISLERIAYAIYTLERLKWQTSKRTEREILKYFDQLKQMGIIANFSLVPVEMKKHIKYTLNPTEWPVALTRGKKIVDL